MARTAIDQRDTSPPPRVEVVAEAQGSDAPAGRRLISSPRELDAVIRRVPVGRVVTLGVMRDSLAHTHRADYTCPRTTSQFLVTLAEAAEEERAAGGGRIAPYWRVVGDDGSLIDSLPGGLAAQARILTTEGVTVLHLGKVPKVTTIAHFAWRPPPLGRAAANKDPDSAVRSHRKSRR